MKRVLIVEDNDENRRYLVYLLGALGFDTSEAVDGVDGLTQANAGEFDLILVDLQMPRLDGFEMLRTFRMNRPNCSTPVVALTAFAASGERELGIAAGFDDYLTKPLRPADLIAAVHSLVT